jgi:hypothetical protein
MITEYQGAGKSNVTGYALGPESIEVVFKGGASYIYTYRSAGPEHVEKMKQLAVTGEGLASYINKHVRKLYASKHLDTRRGGT